MQDYLSSLRICSELNLQSTIPYSPSSTISNQPPTAPFRLPLFLSSIFTSPNFPSPKKKISLRRKTKKKSKTKKISSFKFQSVFSSSRTLSRGGTMHTRIQMQIHARVHTARTHAQAQKFQRITRGEFSSDRSLDHTPVHTHTHTQLAKGRTCLAAASTRACFRRASDSVSGARTTRGFRAGFREEIWREEPRDGRRSTEATLSRILLAHCPSFLAALPFSPAVPRPTLIAVLRVRHRRFSPSAVRRRHVAADRPTVASRRVADTCSSCRFARSFVLHVRSACSPRIKEFH